MKLPAGTTVPMFDWCREAFSTDRRGYWRTMRKLGPVVKVNGWATHLTHRAEVVAALRNYQVFASDDRISVGYGPLVPVAYAPPEHTRYRKILNPLFTPQALAPLAPGLHARVAELINAVAVRGECDPVEDVAVPFLCDGLLMLCGLPKTDRFLQLWRTLAARGTKFRVSDRDAVVAYLADATTAQLNEPRGLLAHLADALSLTEIVSCYSFLALAGIDTTAAVAGCALHELAGNPALRGFLREHPDQISAFTDEMIRLNPPLPKIERRLDQNVTVGGVRLDEGDNVTLCLEAANPDDPLTISDGRIIRHQHWTFGGGIHRCLGKHMARVWLTVLLTEWLTRIPDFELASQPRLQSFGTASLDNLRLRWPTR